VAQAIHYESARATRPFVAVNCAAIPRDLVESELFGHERGAFTGAVTQHSGYFVQADGGTLFLDEVGEIDLNVQVKLLRVLETLRVRRLGGSQDIPVDVRVISASNCDLKHLLETGRFRQDLYYRIAGIEVIVPPLRERGGDDIMRLTEVYLEKMSAQLRRPVPVIAPDAAAALARYRWPGNVRELQNVLQRMLVSTREERLTIDAVPMEVRKGQGPDRGSAPTPTWGAIRQALGRHRNNISAAARDLGLSRHQLRRRVHAHRLKMQKKSS
jgi:DNA-binding NtrC family response regulator